MSSHQYWRPSLLEEGSLLELFLSEHCLNPNWVFQPGVKRVYQNDYSFLLMLHIPRSEEIQLQGVKLAPGTRYVLIRENTWEWCAMFKAYGSIRWKSQNGIYISVISLISQFKAAITKSEQVSIKPKIFNLKTK